MTANRNLYNLAVAATAVIIITATFGAYYYTQYAAATSDNSTLAGELNNANANYTRLASNFNSLLPRYNETISLLSRAIAVMNTSDPAYVQASLELSGLWQAYLTLKPAAPSLLVNSVLLDYGNGTRLWHNSTAVQAGWNLYVETVVLTHGKVTAQWYPQYGEHFVTGIGGVIDTTSKSWFVWSYTKPSWQLAQTGADGVLASAGSVLAWTYCGVDQSYNPTCTP
ncbi:MAG: hypothetical protein OK438_05830 [Thaumarchaeota archaeon]|nr:hypothetical protein [Nitrososphaerota archaeon]